MFKQIKGSCNACSDYFWWIYEHPRPWAEIGITKEIIEATKDPTFFKLVTLDGKVYMEKYKRTFQIRDVFHMGDSTTSKGVFREDARLGIDV